MLNKLKNYFKANMLLKIASYNSVSVFVRLITGFITSKAMAFFLGPSGMAIAGNLSNFMQSVESLSSLGIKNGVIKYVADSKADKLQLKKVISSSFLLVLCVTIVLSILLYLFSDIISQFVFKNNDYSFLFKIAALIVPFYSVQMFFLAIINGLQKIKALVQINIISYIIAALLIVFLMYKQQLEGALLAIILTPILLFISLFFKYRLLKQIISNIDFTTISNVYFKKIASFFSMTLFSGIMIPIVFLLIRNHIIENIGATDAGYWEAMRKISNYYMLFVYTLFSMYLLPMLSEAKTDSKFRDIIFNFYKSLLPIIILGFVFIYLFRFLLIKVVFTNDFLPTEQLFLWQLVGDFFKIVSFTIAIQLQAKRMIKLYLLCELFYISVIYFTSIYLIDSLGILGVVKAHTITFVLYTLLMLFVFKDKIFVKKYAEQSIK